MEIVELLLDKGAKVSAVDKVSVCLCLYIHACTHWPLIRLSTAR